MSQQIDGLQVIQYILGQEKANKHRYTAGLIDLKTLQADYKKSDQIKQYILFLMKDAK